MLDTLNDDDFLASVALFWTQTCWAWALTLTHRPWIFAFITFDLALFVMRWRLRRGMSLGVPLSRATAQMLPAWLNLLMVAQVAILAFCLFQIPLLQANVLAVFIPIGFCGYVCGVSVAFPVLAMLNIVTLNLALGLGLATGASREIRPLAIVSIGSVIAFFSLMRRTHGILVGAIVAQHANRQLSLHDPLTKLPNRTFMRERLTHLIAAIGTDDADTIAVLCLDLDGFKEINDRHGHATGDLVLRRVAGVLRDALETGDFACRAGGDEYVVLLARAGTTRAHAVADAIIRAIAMPLDIGHVAPARIGVSIGVTIAADDARSIDELLQEADAALYRAKRSGKGRLQFHEPFAEAEGIVVGLR